MTPILNEYQQDTRNARLYRTANGQWGVLTFDSQDDFNGFETFDIEEDAETFAETWVRGK